jgi:hypothetical protein
VALARLVTFVPLTLIKSADVNGEFNNILNNPIALVSPTTGAINFNLVAHTNLIPAAITASSATAGQALIATTSGGTQFGNPTGAIAQAGSNVRGLIGTLTSQSATFQADQYLVQSTTGTQTFVMNSTAPFTINLGLAGPAANGRDIAAVFASTYVHYYMITTGVNSTTPAGLVSTATPPNGPVAMPTSYSAWTYLGGSVYSSASTSLPKDHRARGAWFSYSSQITEVQNGNTTAETSVSLTGSIPTNALESKHNFATLLLPGAGNGQTLAIRAVSGSDFIITSTTASSVTGIVDMMGVILPNISNQYFYLYSSQLASANDGLQASISAYKMPNGDA